MRISYDICIITHVSCILKYKLCKLLKVIVTLEKNEPLYKIVTQGVNESEGTISIIHRE